MPIYRKFYGPVCGLLANPQSYMHSGQNIDKIFTCVRYFTGLEKLPGAFLWNVCRSSNKEPLCQFIGHYMVRFSNKRKIVNKSVKFS